MTLLFENHSMKVPINIIWWCKSMYAFAKFQVSFLLSTMNQWWWRGKIGAFFRWMCQIDCRYLTILYSNISHWKHFSLWNIRSINFLDNNSLINQIYDTNIENEVSCLWHCLCITSSCCFSILFFSCSNCLWSNRDSLKCKTSASSSFD